MIPHYPIGIRGKSRLSHAQVINLLRDHGLIPLTSKVPPVGFPTGQQPAISAGADPSDVVYGLTGASSGGFPITYTLSEVLDWLAAQ